METAKDIEAKLKAAKPYLASEFGVADIGYFGSFAKGTNHTDSDLDVLVSFSRKIGWRFFDLKDYLEKLVGRKVNLVTERSIRKQWKSAILQQVKYI